MGGKGEYKRGCDQAGALGMGVGWDMIKFAGACVCGPACEHVCGCRMAQGPHSVLLPLYEGAYSSVVTAGQLSAPPFDEQSHSSQLWNDVTRIPYFLMQRPTPLFCL